MAKKTKEKQKSVKPYLKCDGFWVRRGYLIKSKRGTWGHVIAVDVDFQGAFCYRVTGLRVDASQKFWVNIENIAELITKTPIYRNKI